MGMLFKKTALFDSLTVGDNIAFPLREKTSLSEDAIQKKVEYFHGAKWEDSGTPALSIPTKSPEACKNASESLARSPWAPQMVLYDDPTAGLDPITSRRIIELDSAFARGARFDRDRGHQ